LSNLDSGRRLCLECCEERFAGNRQFLLESFRAITIAAGPGLGSVFMPAIAPRMGILHAQQIKVLLPIRTLLLERSRAETGLHPVRRPVCIHAGVSHVMLVLVTGDRAQAECAVLDRLQQGFFPSCLHSCFDQIPHIAQEKVKQNFRNATTPVAIFAPANLRIGAMSGAMKCTMPDTSGEDPASSSPAWFVTTHWSVVLAAGRSDSTRAVAAMENLFKTYWYPLYAFVRRLGHSPQDAEDLVQSFFTRCLRKNYWVSADRNKGRFRSFLLIVLKRFLANEWDKARALKRGGGENPLALDSLTAEERYALEPADVLSPDKLYDRRWALTLLEHVLGRLEKEQQQSGNGAAFAELKPFLTGQGGDSYTQVAERLGSNDGAVKVTVHRLRKRYRALLEEEIANTVSSPEEVQEERRFLLSVVSQ
jgi:RNA polymerase sigma factor (sigma-70 family)